MKKSIWAAFFWGCLTILGCIAPSMRATAAEGLVLAGPIGGPNLGAALLPPPGLYLGVADVNALTAHLIDGSGNRVDSNSEWTKFLSISIPVLYVYPTEVFGGRISSSILTTYVNSCLKLLGHETCPQGFGDPYADLFFWSRTFHSASTSQTTSPPPGAPPVPYGLTVGAGLGASIPVGRYNKSSLLNPGNYTSGPILDAAGAVSEGFGPLKIGMAYDYHIQLEADYTNGQSVGKRNIGASVGPVVSYDFMLAKHPCRLKVRDFRNVYSRNNLETNTLAVVLTTRF
jgi:hypothetical protein